MKRLSSTVLPLPLLLGACGAAEPPPAVPDPTVAITPAPVEAPPERPDFPGVITAARSKVIPAVFGGPVEKIFVHPRKRVKANELIARLNPVELQSQVDGLRAQERGAGSSAGAAAAAAASAANQAKADCRLYNRGFGSRNACTAARLRAAEARGQIGAAGSPGASARAQRLQLEEQIAKANLPSPIDGVVTIIKVKEGEVVQRGQAIATVFDDSDLIIRFAVPKEHKHLLKMGGRVELRVADLEKPIWADISQISDVEPPISFTVVEADIDDSKLRPGELTVASEGRVRLVDVPHPTTATAQSSQPQAAQAGANQ